MLLALIIATPVSALTIRQGDTLWGLFGTGWKQVALQNGITDPTKLQIGQNIIEDAILGGVVPQRPTEFKTSLGEQKTTRHSDTTLIVTSITTKDGYTLSPTVLGNKIVLSINPGASNSETVLCTGLTTSTKTFTGCTFGYRFDNPTLTTTNNIQPHSPGESVIISNPDTYLSQVYMTLDGDSTITANDTVTGLWTFNTLPYLSTSTPTDPRQAVSLYQFQQATSTGGTNGSELVKGVWQGATGAQAGASTLTGSTGARLVVPTSITTSTGGVTSTIPVTRSDNGRLDATFGGLAWSLANLDGNTLVVQNPASATSTPTATSIPIATASGTLDTWVSSNLQTYTAGEAINASAGPLAVYLQTDGKVYKTTSATASTTIFGFIGFALMRQSVSANASILVQTGGVVPLFSGLTTSSLYYLNGTAGQVSTTAGTIVYSIGKSITPTTLLIEKGKKVNGGYLDVAVNTTTTITLGYRPIKVDIFAMVDGVAVANQGFSMGGWDVNNGNICIGYAAAAQSSQSKAFAVGDATNNETGNVINITNTGFDITNVRGGSGSVSIKWQAQG